MFSSGDPGRVTPWRGHLYPAQPVGRRENTGHASPRVCAICADPRLWPDPVRHTPDAPVTPASCPVANVGICYEADRPTFHIHISGLRRNDL